MSKKRVVVLGGGFGGLFTALELAGNADVTLVTQADHFLFTPMLYEYLSGEVEAWHIAPKYSELVEDNIKVITNTAQNIDLESHSVSLESDSTSLSYDVLVLAVGGVTNYVGVPGAEEFSIPFRQIENADRLRKRMVEALDRVPPCLLYTSDAADE